MTQVRDVLGRARPLAVAVAFTVAAIIPTLALHSTSADALTYRSLETTSSVRSGGTYSTSDVAGEAGNGNEVGHTYTFRTEDAGAIQGISFEVCSTAFGYLDAGTCEGAAGEVTGFSAPATFPAVTVNGVAFTYTQVDASYWTLTNGTGTTLTPAPTEYTVTFAPTETQSFMNPDTNTTYFVHITLWTTSTQAADYDANKASLVDEGTVTSATVNAIDINTRVQETLKFSVEGDMRNNTANTNTGTPTAGTGAFNGPTDASTSCAPLAGVGTILMGDSASNALASSDTFDAVSYFRLATNSAHGARVLYAGDTLSSGSETITPIGAPAAIDDPSATNTEQFGLGLIAVPNKAVGDVSTEIDFDGGGTYLNAALTSGLGYGSGATNAGFESTESSPVLLASSGGIVQCDTGAVRYIANIADETAAGIYATRVVYIASPSY